MRRYTNYLKIRQLLCQKSSHYHKFLPNKCNSHLSSTVLVVAVFVAAIGVASEGVAAKLVFLVVGIFRLSTLQRVSASLRLVLSDSVGLLLVERSGVDVPRFLASPTLTHSEFVGVGIVIHFFGLAMLGVVASVPAVVAVGVDYQSSVILGRNQVFEAHGAVGHSLVANHVFVGVEQFHKCAVAAIHMQNHIAILVERLYLEFVGHRVVCHAIHVAHRRRIEM